MLEYRIFCISDKCSCDCSNVLSLNKNIFEDEYLLTDP